jgi:hypothetical protein
MGMGVAGSDVELMWDAFFFLYFLDCLFLTWIVWMVVVCIRLPKVMYVPLEVLLPFTNLPRTYCIITPLDLNRGSASA